MRFSPHGRSRLPPFRPQQIGGIALRALVGRMLMIYDHGVTARLAAEQERYRANSRLLSLAEWRQRPFAGQVAQNLARLLSPLL